MSLNIISTACSGPSGPQQKIIPKNIIECFDCYFLILNIVLTPESKKSEISIKKTSFVLKK